MHFIVQSLLLFFAHKCNPVFGQIAEDDRIPVEERMIRVVMALRLEETEGAGGKDMIKHLHRPQNALMHQKSKRIIMNQVPPILAIVLEDGIKQGLFDTPYPLECMEMVVAYLNTILDDGLVVLTEEERLMRIEAFIPYGKASGHREGAS